MRLAMKTTGLWIPVLLMGTSPALAQCTARVVVAQVVAVRKPPIADVKGEDFRAKLGGLPITVANAAPLQRPRRVLIVVDASGSMRGEPWTAAISLARRLVESAPHSTIGFSAVSEVNNQSAPFATGSQERILRLLGTLSADDGFPKGKSPVLDAVRKDLQSFSPSHPGDEIVLITDGFDNFSDPEVESATREMSAAGVQINTILLRENDPSLSSFQRTQWKTVIDTLAVTGGRTVIIDPYRLLNDPKAKIGYEELAVNLVSGNGEWVVTLTGAPRRAKWGKWSLEVVDAKNRARKDVVVEFPKWWPPCK